MALSNTEKVQVITNDTGFLPADFKSIFKLEMVKHAFAILFGENSETYNALTGGRKALVDMSNRVIQSPDTYIDTFIIAFANDSEVANNNIEAKIPDVIPAIFPAMAGLIRFDRPS